MNRSRLIRWGVLLVAIWGSSSAWGLERVILQLKWKHQFQFAGYYAAIEQGYYRDAGFDVSLREAEEGVSPVDEVLSGRADFGVGTSELALLRAQGKPVVALAVIFQHSPLTLITRRDRGIDSIHALMGKRVMLLPEETEFFAYLKQEKVPIDHLIQVPPSFHIQDLVDGKVDAISGYSSDEPEYLQRLGVPYNTFSPRSAGIDFYGDTLYTTERAVDENPSRVSAFRDATLRGWQYAFQHPEAIAHLIQARYSTRHSLRHLLFEAEELRRLSQPELVELGYMSEGRWQAIADTYADLGLVPAPARIDGLIFHPEVVSLPAWVQPSLFFSLLGLLALGALLYRVSRINRELNDTVAERDTALVRLSREEERYRLLAENSHDVIWLYDLDHEAFLYVSPAVVRIRGWDAEAAQNQRLREWFPEEALARLGPMLTPHRIHLMAGGAASRTLVLESDLPHRDGSLIPTESVITYIYDDTGHPTRLLGVTRSISSRRRLELQLQQKEQRLAVLLDHAPVAIIVWSPDFLVQEWNREAENIFGWTREETLNRNWLDLMVPPGLRTEVETVVRTAMRQSATSQSINRNRTRSGREILCDWRNTAIRDAKGQVTAVISIAMDITDHERTQNALRQSEERYRRLTENAPFPLIITSMADNSVVYINQMAAQRFGVPRDEAQEKTAWDYWEKAEDRKNFIAQLSEQGHLQNIEVRLKTAAGEGFWATLSATLLRENDQPLAFVSFHDITARKLAESAVSRANAGLQTQLEEIRILQDRLTEQAVRDGLTGLHNRRYLDETIEREVARAKRDQRPLSVVMLDLDHFKRLNDTFGHHAGDMMLRRLADILREDTRAEDVVSRYGGEEFLILLPGMALDHARERAEKWRTALEREALTFGHARLQTTASFGIATFPEHGETPDALTRAADDALYAAKRGGRNRIEIYREALSTLETGTKTGRAER